MRGLTLQVAYSLLVAALAASLFWPNFALISLIVGARAAIFSEDCSWMNCRGTSRALTERVKVIMARPNDCSIPISACTCAWASGFFLRRKGMEDGGLRQGQLKRGSATIDFASSFSYGHKAFVGRGK